MSAARLLLCGLALGAFALAAFAFDKAPDPIERTVEYKQSTHVFQGTVAKLTRLNTESKADSNGTNYTLDLTLAAVLKPEKKGKLKKGDVVAITGRTTDGKVKYDLPEEKDEVIAFVTQNKAGKYEALEPKGYLALSSGRGSAKPIGLPAKAESAKDKVEKKEDKDK